MRGVRVNRAGLRLALDTADGGRFNAVVHGISHQMHQRVHQPLHDARVDFRMFTEVTRFTSFP